MTYRNEGRGVRGLSGVRTIPIETYLSVSPSVQWEGHRRHVPGSNGPDSTFDSETSLVLGLKQSSLDLRVVSSDYPFVLFQNFKR